MDKVGWIEVLGKVVKAGRCPLSIIVNAARRFEKPTVSI